MRSAVGYEKRIADRARSDNKPMFTVDIDRRHCANLPDEERGRMTIQGPATPKTTWLVRQLLLRLSHVSEGDILNLLGTEPQS